MLILSACVSCLLLGHILQGLLSVVALWLEEVNFRLECDWIAEVLAMDLSALTMVYWGPGDLPQLGGCPF